MDNHRPTRRQFLTLAGSLGGVAALVPIGRVGRQGTTARLRARPGSPDRPAEAGRHPLPEAAGRGAYLHVPPDGPDPAAPVPLLVLLHGASRSFPPMDRLTAQADRRGVALLVPMAGNHTWDLMLSGRYGSDVRRLDAALTAAFERVRADPRRLCLAGFSDGASYALSVGLQNGDLFSHLIAFSPGYIGPGRPAGQPRVFISHGLADRILPIERTSARIRRTLEERNIDVRYHEFDGGHGVPVAAETEALDWLLD